jgi:hypothetical protein
MHWRWIGAVAVAIAGWSMVPAGVAQPPAPADFCARYPDAPACATGEVTCDTCHTVVPALNVYGADVAAQLAPGEERPLHVTVFSAELGDALAAVEELDSDLDAYTNVEEIGFGSDPADPESRPVKIRCRDDDRKDAYDLCDYDPDYAFKKIHLDFCGQSPTYEQMAEFDGKADTLHEALDECLDSAHWRAPFGVLWNLANARIGPVQAIKAGRDAGPIPLADYDDDYAYWVWSQTDGRDAREVLVGIGQVVMNGTGANTEYEWVSRGPFQDLQERGFDRGQLVRQDRRAGLITHRWFLMSNTMFTSVPRTTASAAYRHYLGYDLARLEGLFPVDGEPADYDAKNVGVEGCENCHSTLDPLSYPFSRYEGIGGGDGTPFTYNENRMPAFEYVDGPRIGDTPEAGMLFGEPVADLLEWADVAANSEAFRRKLVLDYWRLLVGEDPSIEDRETFSRLVDDLATVHGYSVEAMLHDLIDTEAYGAP